MPAQIAVLNYAAEFPLVEYEQLSRGVIPGAMENKWFVFMEHDTLHIHRSWTGYCIYQVAFERYAQWYRVCSAVVNRNPEQYAQTDNDYDVKVLDYVIASEILGYEQVFPRALDVANRCEADVNGRDHAQPVEPLASKLGRASWWKKQWY